MRTTIDLPEDLHEIARSIARELRRGLSRDSSLRVETRSAHRFLVLHGTGPITRDDVRALEDDQ